MAGQKPNILFIITDHHAFFDHHTESQRAHRMPGYQRIAREGVRFDRCYSVCPICSPARASIMTGMYPSAHGMRWNTDAGACRNNNDLRPGTVLYSNLLSRAGYRNAYVGKWHAGAQRLPVDYGIEGWSLPDYGKVYMSEAYQEYCRARGLGEPRATIDRNVDHPEWEGTTMVLHHPSPWHFMNSSGVLQGPPEAHEVSFVADLAVEKLLELAAGRQPFSLVASFWSPHHPYFPSEPYASRFEPASIPRYPSFDDDYRGKPQRHLVTRDLHHSGVRRWREWPVWQGILARCYGQMLQLDTAVLRVLDALEELGIADNTLVMYCADHGDAVASHDGLWDKGSTYIEEVARVPMAVRWPASFAGGHSTNRLVSNLDTTGTLLDAAGVEIPPWMHTRSLLGLCRDPAGAAWPDQVVSEHHGHGEDMVQRIILRGDYKYVAVLYGGDELYDLSRDPWEMRNLVEDPAYREVKSELRLRLIEHLERTRDPVAGWLLHLLRLAG